MTLKMKLTASISAFVLIIGLMLMGVFAVNQATVNMGGSINFTATDVYARVTGKIENAQGEYADKELPTIEFSAENDTPDQSEWSGLNLLFDDDATPIVITVTVENLAKDRKLTASLTDNTAINENLVKDLKQDGVTYTSGTTKDLDASTGDGTSTTTYVVTFSIADHNKSLPQMDFELDISLYDESETPEEPEYEILEGFTFDDNGTLISYTGTDTEVVIPSSYSIIEGEPVDKTLEFASLDEFYNAVMSNASTFISMTNFTIIVDDSSYGPYGTFNDFDMDENVMEAMRSATSIIFKYQENGDKYVEGNDYQVTAIGYGAFAMNTNITKINLPSSLTSIGEGAFQGCTNLQPSVTDQGVEYLGNSDNPYLVLWNGTGITTSSYTINEKCKFIYYSAFNDCRGLTSITLPSSLTSIGERAFQGCSGLETLEYKGTIEQWLSIDFDSGWMNDDSHTFHTFIVNGGELTNLVVPEGVTRIGSSAFAGCSGLTEVDLSQCTSLTSIGDSAFRNCSGLTSITLLSSLTSIGDFAFWNCSGLLTEVDLSQCTSLISIGVDAFWNCSGLTEVDLSQCTSLISIGDSAFSSCNGLTSITLPSSLTSIGEWAFSYCSELTEVDLSQCTSLTSIGEYAFAYCGNLDSITFPNTTGWYATTSSTSTSGIPMDMSNPTQNATLLTDTYNNYYFKRNA